MPVDFPDVATAAARADIPSPMKQDVSDRVAKWARIATLADAQDQQLARLLIWLADEPGDITSGLGSPTVAGQLPQPLRRKRTTRVRRTDRMSDPMQPKRLDKTTNMMLTTATLGPG